MFYLMTQLPNIFTFFFNVGNFEMSPNIFVCCIFSS